MADDFVSSFVETMRIRYDTTQNPIWVWQAILACGRGVDGAEHAIPAWCLEYLYESASAINGLWGNKAVTPAEAIKRLPSLMKFSSAGKNEFKNAAADQHASQIAVDYLVRTKTRSAGEVTGELLGAGSTAHDTLRKQLTRGRKINRLPQREKPKG